MEDYDVANKYLDETYPGLTEEDREWRVDAKMFMDELREAFVAGIKEERSHAWEKVIMEGRVYDIDPESTPTDKS